MALTNIIQVVVILNNIQEVLVIGQTLGNTTLGNADNNNSILENIIIKLQVSYKNM